MVKVYRGDNYSDAGGFAADNRPVYSARPSASGTTQWAYSTDGFRYYTLSSRGVTYFDREGYESTGAVVRHELGPVIVERQNGIDTVTAVLTDRLGSTIATVDTTTQTRAYDAFGQVRDGDLTNKPDGTLNLPGSIRGFTQHEHADDVRLIHMKGRLYDYKLGRFLSVDPLVQFPENSQSLNPYSYIMNNPLAGTDPTGFAIKGSNGGCTAMTGSRICGVNTGAAGGVTSKTTIARDGEGGYVRITESKGAYGERSFTGVWRPGNGAKGQSSYNKSESPSDIEGSKTRGQEGLQRAADFGKAFADTAGKVLEVVAPIDPDHPFVSVIFPVAGKAVGGAVRAGGGGLFRKMEKEALDEINAERAALKGLEIAPGKFDYLFGRVSSNAHNAARSNQLALEMKRLGVPDTAAGRQMLSEHLALSARTEGNIARTFSNDFGNFEVRESFFMGPSGNAAKFESTFQVLDDGTRRLSTVIPFH